MALPDLFKNRLRLPAVAAPMFLTSGPQLVIETCKAGVVGTFPALNQRTSEGFEQWLIEITEALTAHAEATGSEPAPYGVNLIVHGSNPRLEADLALCVKYKVPLIITSLGAVAELIDTVHSYGGLVFHDVINARHATKAAAAGVDGLIAVAAGAGGHAGTTSPFALINEIRQFFDKTVLLAGSLSTGRDIATAQMMGADLAYLGTRFINTQESLVPEEYRQMIVDTSSKDILYTPNISGVYANFMRPSIVDAGLDPDDLEPKKDIDFGSELTVDADNSSGDKAQGAWKTVWSAGQGVGSIHDSPPVAELVDRLGAEYRAANSQQQQNSYSG